ncbi:MAG: response regulator transcription factor [Vicinamibacterales bacterium]
MPSNVLLVEDEAAARTTLGNRLRQQGYAVDCASTREGFEKATLLRFDLILLDLLLPGRSGLAVCRDIRRAGLFTPILILAPFGETADVIAWLKIGADDYITKPFKMRELLARIEVLLRRPRKERTNNAGIYKFGSIGVDVQAAETTREGNVVNLFAREFRLLRYFLEHPGVTFSREDLLSAVWGRSQKLPTRTVDMHIASLRGKLEHQPRQPQHFLTVHRVGYKFKP